MTTGTYTNKEALDKFVETLKALRRNANDELNH